MHFISSIEGLNICFTILNQLVYEKVIVTFKFVLLQTKKSKNFGEKNSDNKVKIFSLWHKSYNVSNEHLSYLK